MVSNRASDRTLVPSLRSSAPLRLCGSRFWAESTVRILVVEDEPALRQQLERELKAQDYTVDATGDGKEALYFATDYPVRRGDRRPRPARPCPASR